MATSSITKNFVISGKEQVEMFIAALEAAEEELAKGEPEWRKVEGHLVTDKEELKEMMENWRKAHAGEE